MYIETSKELSNKNSYNANTSSIINNDIVYFYTLIYLLINFNTRFLARRCTIL